MELSKKQEEWAGQLNTFMEKHGILHIAPTYTEEDQFVHDEFSMQYCDTCNTHMGGTRYKVVGVTGVGQNHKKEDNYDLSICEDCFMFYMMGEIPDEEYL